MEKTSQMLKTNTQNTQQKEEQPEIIISLDFSNNLFQTFLMDIFERLNIEIKIEHIRNHSEKIFNLIQICYKEEYSFIQFYDAKFLADSINNKNIFKTLSLLLDIAENPNNVVCMFYDIKKKDFADIRQIEFFLNSKLKVKTIEIASNRDLFEFLENFFSIITSKEERAKTNIFDLKPVTNSNLAELENISEISRIWVKHLMCIPGISEMKAISIVKMYPTFKSLIDVYESDEFSESEKEKFLKDIEIVSANNSTKKRIGEAVSSKVYKYFTSQEFHK